MNTPDVVERIKQYLWNGQVVAFSGLVPEGYDAPTFVDGVLYEQKTIPNSGHGQIIVGYDDTVGSPTLGRGAFLVQNSFGTGWPPASSGSAAPPGQAYWSYETFVKTQLFGAVAYPVRADRPAVLALAKSTPDAPEAFVTEASQWARSSDADVYLILQLHFEEPVVLEGVALRGPTAQSAEFSARYANYIADGYAYFRRADAQQFESGEYDVTLHAVTLANTRVTYTGKLSVGSAAPGMPPSAPVTADTPIFGTTGASATIALPFPPGFGLKALSFLTASSIRDVDVAVAGDDATVEVSLAGPRRREVRAPTVATVGRIDWKDHTAGGGLEVARGVAVVMVGVLHDQNGADGVRAAHPGQGAATRRVLEALDRHALVPGRGPEALQDEAPAAAEIDAHVARVRAG